MKRRRKKIEGKIESSFEEGLEKARDRSWTQSPRPMSVSQDGANCDSDDWMVVLIME